MIRPVLGVANLSILMKRCLINKRVTRVEKLLKELSLDPLPDTQNENLANSAGNPAESEQRLETLWFRKWSFPDLLKTWAEIRSDGSGPSSRRLLENLPRGFINGDSHSFLADIAELGIESSISTSS
ncbi:7445_t:CDS:2 [Ambispora gerdemannii]|uniref:7445_t:CDS:1 n=1 Tax=Ambispora gerdemannii TaxID=144530 RepID=A0A9N8YQ36_9GLOM|nr:7445_t:CDS:2 [Ambispora gerdemannii]